MEHAYQAGPGAGPICDSQNWTAMRRQARQNMMRILPNGLRDDQGAVRIEPAKNFEAHFLRIDESMFFLFIECIRALNVMAFALDRLREQCLHPSLLGPALFVGGRTE